MYKTWHSRHEPLAHRSRPQSGRQMHSIISPVIHACTTGVRGCIVGDMEFERSLSPKGRPGANQSIGIGRRPLHRLWLTNDAVPHSVSWLQFCFVLVSHCLPNRRRIHPTTEVCQQISLPFSSARRMGMAMPHTCWGEHIWRARAYTRTYAKPALGSRWLPIGDPRMVTLLWGIYTSMARDLLATFTGL